MSLLATDQDEQRGQLTYVRLMMTGALSLARLILTSSGDFKRLRLTRPAEDHYVRPPRQYELPRFEPGMRVSTSTEKYLRPTRFCDPRAPEVAALAHQLGAYRKPDLEFATAAFEFVKEKVLLEICPIDSAAETLRRGTGTCFQLITVFIALCRAAGVKARYKMFATNMIQAWRTTMIDSDLLVKKWYDAVGYFMLEGEGEAFVDGEWRVAHVGPTAERQAAAGLPVTRFGEDAIGIWLAARPGSVMRLESIPLGLGAASRRLHHLAPGSLERVNLSIQRQTEQGARVLAQAGGVEAYDARVRQTMSPRLPQVSAASRPTIVFRE